MSASCVATTLYSVFGIFLGYLYYRSEGLRADSRIQWATVLVIILASALTLAVPATAPDHLDVHYRSLEGLLFLAASLCYLPLLVYILVFQWNVLIERLTTPGQRREAKAPQRSSKEEWATVERLLGALSLNPLDSQRRRQLADTYVRLDLTQSAIGEFRKAIECIDRGYEQAYLLYKTAHLLADVQENIPAAVPLCRRIIRLYPKSYFAAYARRVVSHYEAHYMSQWR